MKKPLAICLLTTAVSLAGCSTTETISYPSNPNTDLEQIPADTELMIEMADGTEFTTSRVRVAGDSLFFSRRNQPRLGAHRDDVAAISMRRADGEKTAGVVVGVIGLAAVVALIGSQAADDAGCETLFGDQC